MRIFTIVLFIFICTGAFAQPTREELSKELKKPGTNIEQVVSLVADNFNKSKEKRSSPQILFVGATSSQKNLNLNYQLTIQINNAQLEKLKAGAKGLAESETCVVPIIYVLLKEHGLTANILWFDQNMKQIIKSVVDVNGCTGTK